MNSKIRYFIPIILSCIIFLSFNYFSCSNNDEPLFGDTNESPLKGHSYSSKAYDIQTSFREIYKNLVQLGFKINYSGGMQPLVIPWRLTTRFASLNLPGPLSSQLVFLSRKAKNEVYILEKH